MIIPIRQRTGQSEDIPVDKLEWVMLELNGELLQPLDKIHTIQQGAVGPGGASAAASSKKRTVELGSVRVDTDGIATLIIGNHELKGTSTKLKEPFAVLRKRKLKNVEVTKTTQQGVPIIASPSGVEYEVAGIVKKKLKFDQYPKSIMR
mmetsp:Transcript_9326/g.19624  ORF Transcript_9326/g.19624 Transcript_9326/m.19624 type:complete len:149 (-) Transcript_9326:359-805(-)